ncbi:hypothetical protein QQS21_003710 [Conoideocrella luteorostrata]|uniref:Thioredoxin domain-containing protein n=1 Tax=Conoideocrella luteorostrata TaxID=1105319 RepID=A0AAJ0G0C1_9HYPO|nr:hypothetical protein QQS21_003710 [Conoideocrella luteorostrata]
MPVITITSKSQFDSLIKSTPFVALQASASWCGPCKAISPHFVKHSEKGIDETFVFAKFDTDDVPDLASELEVRSLPTFYFIENENKADATKVTGANPGALKKTVEEVEEKAKKVAENAKTNGGSLPTDEDF